jgi:AraC-like DNA-binding protein
MREFEEQAFDAWLAASYQRHWQDSHMRGWIGARSTDEQVGSYMLLARLELQEGMTAVYGEFKPSQETMVHLEGSELLLTFFIDGNIKGYNANLINAAATANAQNLPFKAPGFLLRKPHAKQGSSVIIPAMSVSRFLQLRMRQQSYFDWMTRLDMPLTQQTMDAWLGDDGAVMFSGQWSPDIRMALQPWRSITAMRAAMLPFIGAKAIQLLTLFSLELHARGTQIQAPSISTTNTLLLQARRVIEHDLTRCPSLVDIASIVGTSVSTIKRMHLAQYGESLMQYSSRVRLAHAKHLVENSGLALSAVAEATGFSNAGRFAKIYRQQLGMLPSDARRNTQGAMNMPL